MHAGAPGAAGSDRLSPLPGALAQVPANGLSASLPRPGTQPLIDSPAPGRRPSSASLGGRATGGNAVRGASPGFATAVGLDGVRRLSSRAFLAPDDNDACVPFEALEGGAAPTVEVQLAPECSPGSIADACEPAFDGDAGQPPDSAFTDVSDDCEPAVEAVPPPFAQRRSSAGRAGSASGKPAFHLGLDKVAVPAHVLDECQASYDLPTPPLPRSQLPPTHADVEDTCEPAGEAPTSRYCALATAPAQRDAEPSSPFLKLLWLRLREVGPLGALPGALAQQPDNAKLVALAYLSQRGCFYTAIQLAACDAALLKIVLEDMRLDVLADGGAHA